jgi:hypothetical protein
VNYWLGLGSVFIVVGFGFAVLGRVTRRHISREPAQTNYHGGVVVIGYLLPLFGVLFLVAGLVETSR